MVPKPKGGNHPISDGSHLADFAVYYGLAEFTVYYGLAEFTVYYGLAEFTA